MEHSRGWFAFWFVFCALLALALLGFSVYVVIELLGWVKTK